MEQSVAYSTWKGYNSSTKQYLKFCKQGNFVPFPVDEIVLILFCVKRVHKVKVTTVFKDLWALQFMSQTIGMHVDFSKMDLLQRTKTGLQKTFGRSKPDSRLPITIEMLTAWSTLINWKDFDQVVMFTVLVVAFFGLLRTSEYAAENKRVKFSDPNVASYKALWLANISANFTNNKLNFYELKICASKIDIFRQTVSVIVGPYKPPVCPVYLLTKMLLMRRKLSFNNKKVKLNYWMPLFVLKNGYIVSKRDVSSFLTALVIVSGLKKKFYKPYSLRIGGATYLAKRGVPDYTIKMMGRWNSSAYRSYIRYDNKYKSEVWKHAKHNPVNNAVVFDYNDDDQDH